MVDSSIARVMAIAMTREQRQQVVTTNNLPHPPHLPHLPHPSSKMWLSIKLMMIPGSIFAAIW
ncbi:hypothetical protein NG799_03035 [Laspinema sp. D1]|uniref:Uncharacterized protein n=1 Tax=Laspinema palackyanum D2a TaxID=2953684 RepID=A0ABT2MKN2_9CYAN|nr:hypothetical protein [Laspinema sp. D2a]